MSEAAHVRTLASPQAHLVKRDHGARRRDQLHPFALTPRAAEPLCDHLQRIARALQLHPQVRRINQVGVGAIQAEGPDGHVCRDHLAQLCRLIPHGGTE